MIDKGKPSAASGGGSDKKDGKPAAPAGPTTGYYLELYFPVTRAILPQHFATEGEAVRASYLHFTTFPKGYAQVRHIASNEVVLNHQQLYQRYLDRPKS